MLLDEQDSRALLSLAMDSLAEVSERCSLSSFFLAVMQDFDGSAAPVAGLETYLLKPVDFAREPGAKPNFAGIQAMFDLYQQAGLLKKHLDVKQFRRDDVTAPLE